MVNSNDSWQPFWEERFKMPGYRYGKEANEFVQSSEPRLVRESSVLCIAEGEGRNAVFLAERGHRVTTWDYAEAAITKQQELAAEKGVTLDATLQVDLRNAPWQKEVWDAIVCVFWSFEEALRIATLDAAADAVKQGGWVIFEVYSKQQLAYGTGGPKELDWLFQLSDFTGAFPAETWHWAHLFTGEVMRSEGELHQGLSHVIQVAVKKRA